MKSLLFIIGTRPEAIKLAPLIRLFKSSTNHNVLVCVTSQHRELLDQVLDFFSIQPDFDLNIMQPNQSLTQLTANVLLGLETIYDQTRPDLVFVQGDTTSAFAASLAAFYKKIKLVHIEAGLRTDDKYSPYPEEMNRLLTSKLSDIHFAPTQRAQENLLKEGITENVFVVGNTVIDALKLGISILETSEHSFEKDFATIDFSKKIILVTCHRREIFGEPFKAICKALYQIATDNPEVQLVYPVHLNPNIKDIAHRYLQHERISLIEPLLYPQFIWLMHKSYLILTDSGGIQEEAPSLGKPVLVLRTVTERMEGVDSGNTKLIGIDTVTIVQETNHLLRHQESYAAMTKNETPYGNGKASEQIIALLKNHLH